MLAHDTQFLRATACRLRVWSEKYPYTIIFFYKCQGTTRIKTTLISSQNKIITQEETLQEVYTFFRFKNQRDSVGRHIALDSMNPERI